MELTDRFIRGAKVDKRTEFADESWRPDIKKKRRGLLLIVEPGGTKSWYVRKKVSGQRFMKTIGTYPDLTLAHARELLDDIDDFEGSPQDALHSLLAPDEPAPSELTVGRLIRRYIEEECEPSNRDWRNQKLVLERELKPYTDLPADKLITENVLAIVQACLDRGSPRTAQEALKQIKGLYNWAMGKKRVRRRTVTRENATQALIRSTIVKLAKNPAEGVIAPTYEPRTYHLEGKALDSFSRKLAESKLRTDCKLILTIQLQTFCRVGEVSGMEWREVDLNKRQWVIPAERYKTGVAHIVQLSRQTVKLLKQLPREGEYAFPMPLRTDKPLPARDVAKEINKVRPSLKQHKDFSSHSLRHTGATWLASQQCSFDVRERLLGHAIDKKADMSQRYQHHQFLEERREWTQKWCDFLEGKPDAKAS